MAHAGPPAFVGDACRSLGSQVYRDFELIVVDDGAGVDWEVLLSSACFPWRVLTSGVRRGLAHSLNRAARAANGALLARMDSDDLSAPSRLQRQVEFFDARQSVDFVGSASYWLDEHDRFLGRNYPLTEPEELSLTLTTYNQLCHGAMVIRRAAFEQLGGYDEAVAVGQDYELWLRALRAGHSFANLADPLYGHRLHSHSSSSRHASKQGALGASLRAREPTLDWSRRAQAWFAAGRQRPLGRPHEPLQMGRLAVLFLAALTSKHVEPSVRRSLLSFIAKHVSGAAELLLREVGWRHDTVVKVRSLLQRA